MPVTSTKNPEGLSAKINSMWTQRDPPLTKPEDENNFEGSHRMQHARVHQPDRNNQQYNTNANFKNCMGPGQVALLEWRRALCSRVFLVPKVTGKHL